MNISENANFSVAEATDGKQRNSDATKSLNFYKGFFDAESRRPVRHADETPGRIIFASILSALPAAALIYFLMRRNAKRTIEQAANANKPDGAQKKGFLNTVFDDMQKMMNPMGDKSFQVTVKETKFKDVIGVPEALYEVQQYVEFLKNPTKFVRLGGRLPKGCLLTGQPGTGKTLLAKAVAGEADVPFFSCSGSDFIEVYAGSGPKRVRDLFAEAKKVAPSVIFVDEIDAVGQRSNGQGAGGISSEENRTVNQLLAELDGLQKDEAVVVFAATNFPDNLDKALLREGRFDRKVEIPMPDKEARVDLFTHYLKKVITGDPDGVVSPPPPPSNSTNSASSSSNTATNIDAKAIAPVPLVPGLNKRLAERMAGLTPGISPATIATIVNEAALAAAVAGNPAVTESTLLPAIDDVLVGKKHRNRMKSEASRRVALHEAGHALVAWMLPQQSRVIKLSITPRGNAAGFTQQIGREVRDHYTDGILFTDICVMLGGRIAELTQHKNLTTGAQDDYQRATKTALNAFLAFGMSKNIGMLAFEYQRLDQGRMYQLLSESMQHAAENEAALLVQQAFDFATSLVKEHEQKLEQLAATLYDKKELLEEDIRQILGDRPTLEEGRLDKRILDALSHFTQTAARVGDRTESEAQRPAKFELA